ncbi:unnamed protein product [Rotaria sp. Silwood2]|nr:unnamed protein product [Rotaria sp. Silwood2]CAF4479345.1 unnamed protein product [Rotaria sp. Silwood2]
MSKRHLSKYHQSRQKHSPGDKIDQLNLRFRTCRICCPQKETDDEQSRNCECRQPEHRHAIREPISSISWSMKLNTREEINAEHGQLKNDAQYVRLALDTPVDTVDKILRYAWNLDEPSFIVSIIGSTEYFSMNDQLETNLINGLIVLIQKSEAWLITNGYDTGITQLVGQAIQKFKLSNFNNEITAIGICKWGCIRNVEQITSNASYSNKRNKLKTRSPGEWDLELNHSHYLMLDDGTIRNYETKDYRTDLVTHVAKINNEHLFDFDKNIANRDIIYGVNELSIEDDNLQCANMEDKQHCSDKLPPLNINKSNRTERHLSSKCEKLLKNFGQNNTQLKEDIKETFFEKQDSKKQVKDEYIKDLLKKVMFCLQPSMRSHLTVFNLNSDTDLSSTIFRSICRSREILTKLKELERNDEIEMNKQLLKKSNLKDKIIDEHTNNLKIMKKDQDAERTRLLYLAMQWNSIDIAREFIFRNSLDNILTKERYFIEVIINDLPDFVYEFLKLGIEPNKIFFSKEWQGSRYAKFIRELYTDECMV